MILCKKFRSTFRQDFIEYFLSLPYKGTYLCRKVGIPKGIQEFHVPADAVPSLASSAMKVQRLLKNNMRELSQKEIEQIYYRLY